MWPERWESCNPQLDLNWEITSFIDNGWGKVPENPGVYCFFVQPEKANLFDTSYLIYIGKTDRTLRIRYREHYRDMQNNRIRPKLYPYLVQYAPYIKFCFAIVEPPNSPFDIEQHLINSFLPPANPQVRGELGDIVNAF